MKLEDEAWKNSHDIVKEKKRNIIRYPSAIKPVQKVKEFSEDFFEHRPDHHVDRDEDLDALVPEFEPRMRIQHPDLKEREEIEQERRDTREDISEEFSRRSI